MATFGERLKELRKAMGFSSAGLAAATDLARGTLLDYEAGRRSPSHQNVLRVCQALGVKSEVFDDVTYGHADRSVKKGDE